MKTSSRIGLLAFVSSLGLSLSAWAAWQCCSLDSVALCGDVCCKTECASDGTCSGDSCPSGQEKVSNGECCATGDIVTSDDGTKTCCDDYNSKVCCEHYGQTWENDSCCVTVDSSEPEIQSFSTSQSCCDPDNIFKDSDGALSCCLGELTQDIVSGVKTCCEYGQQAVHGICCLPANIVNNFLNPAVKMCCQPAMIARAEMDAFCCPLGTEPARLAENLSIVAETCCPSKQIGNSVITGEKTCCEALDELNNCCPQERMIKGEVATCCDKLSVAISGACCEIGNVVTLPLTGIQKCCSFLEEAIAGKACCSPDDKECICEADPEDERCGCPSGQEKVGDECCDSDKVAGTGDSQTCCGSNETVVGDQCCASDKVAGSGASQTCCGEDETVVDGKCQKEDNEDECEEDCSTYDWLDPDSVYQVCGICNSMTKGCERVYPDDDETCCKRVGKWCPSNEYDKCIKNNECCPADKPTEKSVCYECDNGQWKFVEARNNNYEVCGCPNGGTWNEEGWTCCKDGYALSYDGVYNEIDARCGCPDGGTKAERNYFDSCCKNGYKIDTDTGEYNITDFYTCGCPNGGTAMANNGVESLEYCCKDGYIYDTYEKDYYEPNYLVCGVCPAGATLVYGSTCCKGQKDWYNGEWQESSGWNSTCKCVGQVGSVIVDGDVCFKCISEDETVSCNVGGTLIQKRNCNGNTEAVEACCGELGGQMCHGTCILSGHNCCDTEPYVRAASSGCD